MNRYSETSESRLRTCHTDLQVIFRCVLEEFDHSILCGHRPEEEQEKAYMEGKSKLRWPESRHNRFPSMAVDVAPYPIDWRDRERFSHFAGYVKGVAKMLLEEGVISHEIRWGGDWDSDTQVNDNDFDDLPHFELIHA